MKNKIKIILTCIVITTCTLLVESVHGQATMANNALTGTAPNPNEYLGSSNGYHVIFKANGTERMRIDQSNGNVGIGTTAPVNLVHQSTGDSTNNYHQITNGNTGNTSGDGLLIGLRYDVTPNKSYAEFNQQENARMNFLTQGTQRMSIVAGGTGALTGYVGIGNNFSDPQSRLHLTQGTNENCYFQMTGNNTGTAASDGFRIGVLNPNGGPYDVEFRQQENSSDYIWYTTPSGTTAVERMRMKSDGKVGIGTASPNNLVQMHGGDFQMTTATTCSGSGDGFKIDFNSSNIELNQQENANMNFYTNSSFRMQIAAGGNVGIGNTAQSNEKLYVENDYATSGGTDGIVAYTTKTTSGTIYAIKGTAYDGDIAYGGYFYGVGNTNNPTLRCIGANCIATNGHDINYGSINEASTGGEAYGSYATATNATLNFGAIAAASNGGNSIGIQATGQGASNQNYGINAGAGGVANTFNDANIGGNFEATGSNDFVYGIVAGSDLTCATTDPITGMADCPTAAGFFNGDVAATGIFKPSDATLKTDVNDITDGLGIIEQLQPKTYLYDTAQFNFMNLRGDLQYGLLAQDLIPVLPACLKHLGVPQKVDTLGNVIHQEVRYLGVDYTVIIPILIAGMKEQQQQINDLATQVAALQNGNKAAPSSAEPTGQLKVKLADNVLVLEQNQPNPFKENTTINFNIPEDVKSAQILFYNSKGNVISTVDILEKGAGSLMVYGSDLTSGIYTYTLLVDGRVAETKKMMKVK